jgi:MOSC domain-containing protein YiiM
MAGIVRQVNVKPERPGEHGLPKAPVDSAFVSRRGVGRDFNRYRHEKKRDDPDMAVLIMPLETIRELNEEGWPLKPGDIGENFTTEGIGYGDFSPGRAFRIGEAEVQISKACEPCDNLFLLPYVGEGKGPQFLKVMLGRRGWFARVLKEGNVRKGDGIEEVPTQPAPPRHS